MKLSDRKIKALKPTDKPARYSDGLGLFIEVRPTGSKQWRMAYRFEGKQKLLSFGKYPIVTLARARELCIDGKRELSEGIDPRAQAMIARAEYIAQTEHTFEKIAAEYVEKRRKGGLSRPHCKRKDGFFDSPAQILASYPSERSLRRA